MKWPKSKKSKKRDGGAAADGTPSGKDSSSEKSSSNSLATNTTPRRGRTKSSSSLSSKKKNKSKSRSKSKLVSASVKSSEPTPSPSPSPSSLSSHLPIVNSSTNTTTSPITSSISGSSLASSLSSSSLLASSSASASLSSTNVNVVQRKLHSEKLLQQQQQSAELGYKIGEYESGIDNDNGNANNTDAVIGIAETNNLIDSIPEIEESESSSSLSIFKECNTHADDNNDDADTIEFEDSDNEDDQEREVKLVASSSTSTVSTSTSASITKTGMQNENNNNSNSLNKSKIENVANSLNVWMSDMNRLFMSSVFQNAMLSTFTLTTAMSKSFIHLTFYPITKPIQMTTSMIHSTIYTTLFMTNKLLMTSNRFLLGMSPFYCKRDVTNQGRKEEDGRNAHDAMIIPSRRNNTDCSNVIRNCNGRSNQIGMNTSDDDSDSYGVSNILQDIAFHTVPAICNTTQGILNYSLSFLFCKENAIPSTTTINEEAEKNTTSTHKRSTNQKENEVKPFDNVNFEEQTQRQRIEEEEEEGEYIQLVYEEEACENDEMDKQHSSLDPEVAATVTAVLDSTLPVENNKSEILLKEGRKVEKEEGGRQHLEHLEQKTDMEDPHYSSSSPLFCVRICDLNIDNENCSTTNNDNGEETINPHNEEKKDEDVPFSSTNEPKCKLSFLELQLPSTSAIQIIQTANEMIQNGMLLAMNNSMAHERVSWKEEGSTAKVLKKLNTLMDGERWFKNPKVVKALENNVLLWSGSMNNHSKNKMGIPLHYAHKLPCFRARGIIPSIGPRELTDLLLDSSKVKTYNKFSNGRKDILVFQSDLDIVNGSYGSGTLKVVQSETNVPFSSNKLKMTTLLTARSYELELGELNDCTNDGNIGDQKNVTVCEKVDAYIIVSRSVYSHDDMEKIMKTKNKHNTYATPGSRNEIIWGVNILHEIPGHSDKTGMITFTQANSSAVPNFLAQKVGLMVAGDFMKNIRGVNIS